MKGILGKKVGMTQLFLEGNVVPVTVVEAGPCVVLQKKELQTDGYEALQLGFKEKKEKRSKKATGATRPAIGHAAKANAKPQKFIKEIRDMSTAEFELGAEVKAELFKSGELVDVTGTSKGKGFSGSIKRHNQSRGPMSHGSHFHRSPGSLGPIINRVFKGHNLPGRMGGEKVTTQNLEVVRVDNDNNLILIKGAIPGPKNSYVVIRTAVKSNS